MEMKDLEIYNPTGNLGCIIQTKFLVEEPNISAYPCSYINPNVDLLRSE